MRHYVVRDTKAEASFRLFASPTDAAAMRDIVDALRSNEHLRNNAVDFQLVYVGDLDPHTDIWNTEFAPHVLCVLTDLRDLLSEDLS